MSVSTNTGDIYAKTSMPSEIFRAYDIRGVYDSQLNEERIKLIGKGIASEALSIGINTLLLGRDGRLSSPSLSQHLMAGVRETGCNIIDLGIVPTPVLYFATHTTPFHSGIMLTASHNPAAYNGIKIVFKQSCLAANQIQQIKQRIKDRMFSRGQGKYQQKEILQEYTADICSRININRKMKIVIDCANGVTSVIACDLFEALGCEVIPLYCELDGNFPNHDPDPTQVENLKVLQAKVLAHGADIGLAFDGDGDRLAVVTDEGKTVDTDQLLAALITSILPNHPGEAVVFDVKSSSRLDPLIRKLGGVPILHRSGHSFMKQKMQESDAIVGGEFSAHIFIKDRWFGFDDGMYAGARILEILGQSTESSTKIFDNLGPKRYATAELKIVVNEDDKFYLAKRLQRNADFPDAKITLIDGLRVDFTDGWGLVRASNTSPALLLRFEANSQHSLHQIQSRFKQLLNQVDSELPIPF